jgi:hypothetical protein
MKVNVQKERKAKTYHTRKLQDFNKYLMLFVMYYVIQRGQLNIMLAEKVRLLLYL